MPLDYLGRVSRFRSRVASSQWITKLPSMEGFLQRTRTIRNEWGSRNSVVYELALYIATTVVFIFTYSIPISPLVAAIRPACGFLSVIFIPGAFLSHSVLPEKWRNVGTNILMGLMLAILETHLLFTATLVTNLQVPLIIWICMMNALIIIICLAYLLKRNINSLFKGVLRFCCNRRLLLVALIALVLRFVLLYFAQESIAPDASLYADYARGIVEGNFQSSVLNDRAVIAISGNVDYLAHQAFTYVFAVSWLLLPPTASGPTLLLVLIGVALLFPTYSIAEHLFGSRAAMCVASTVAVHPLFVFHSSVAYGPAITALLFTVFGILFFIKDKNPSSKVLLASGIFIGLTDAIWLAGFYVICITIPAVLILLKMLDRNQSLAFSAMMILVVLAVSLYSNIVVFFISWIAIFAMLAMAYGFRPDLGLQKFIPFFFGIASVTFLWSWPLRMASLYSSSASTPVNLVGLILVLYVSAIAFFGFWIALVAAFRLARRNRKSTLSQKTGLFIAGAAAVVLLWIWSFRAASLISNPLIPQTELGPLASAAVSPLSIQFILSFLFFLFFHFTPVLLCLIPLALIRGRNKSAAFALLAAALLAAGGTMKVLSIVSGSLGFQYLYSDSRFFLFMTLMCIISLGAYFDGLAATTGGEPDLVNIRLHITRKQRKCVLVFSLIIVGFVPSYLVMPSGLALVNIEERYAWSGLPSAVGDIGDDSAVFLVDRAREFAWFTGRKSAVLELSNMSLPYANASRELLSLAAKFSTDYLIADGYTLAHWRTLDFLLLEPISIGTSVILGDLEIVEFNESSNNISAPSLTLIAQTEPNEYGSYCRVFGFDTVSFARLREISILDPGWSTSNGGIITNVSGEVRLTIGNDQNSTNTWRPGSFDFDQMVNSGFLLLNLEEISATVARIEVWDENGIILRHAENLGNGLYYCPLGEVTIGDIRIAIEGSSSESIIIRSISVWQVENS